MAAHGWLISLTRFMHNSSKIGLKHGDISMQRGDKAMRFMTMAGAGVMALCAGGAANAATCAESFARSGSIVSATTFTATQTITTLSVADAIGQLHGIAIGGEYDVLDESEQEVPWCGNNVSGRDTRHSGFDCNGASGGQYRCDDDHPHAQRHGSGFERRAR